MDYSYFTSGPQPYHFFNLPPTPAASSTPQPDDYSNNQSAEHYDAAFAAFQQNFHYDPSTFLTQPIQVPPQSPSKSLRHDSIISIPDISGIQPASTDITPDEQRTRSSSSEEKEILTPAQSRRKAQNRAAQRAFRERKERHVKDLEAKLTSLQYQTSSLNGENERLKRELAKVATENEILRATSSPPGKSQHSFGEEEEDLLPGPLGFNPTDAHSNSKSYTPGDISSRPYSSSRTVSVDDDTGQPLLTASATWDYIQTHELVQKGLVDVGDVMERLKKIARCDGKGPVFEEGDIRQAIEESSVAGGRDELI